jgi:hypothetical protein
VKPRHANQSPVGDQEMQQGIEHRVEAHKPDVGIDQRGQLTPAA